MKLSLLCSFFLFCGMAAAQSRYGYVYVAPGAISVAGNSTRSYSMGGGLQQMLDKGVAVGAELGAIGPGERFANNVFGIFSANGYYHPLHNGQKLDPFATAGYTLAFRTGTANLFNYGGGLNYWFQDNIGFLAEFRDHTRSIDTGFNPHRRIHYWGFRFGLTFR